MQRFAATATAFYSAKTWVVNCSLCPPIIYAPWAYYLLQLHWGSGSSILFSLQLCYWALEQQKQHLHNDNSCLLILLWITDRQTKTMTTSTKLWAYESGCRCAQPKIITGSYVLSDHNSVDLSQLFRTPKIHLGPSIKDVANRGGRGQNLPTDSCKKNYRIGRRGLQKYSKKCWHLLWTVPCSKIRDRLDLPWSHRTLFCSIQLSKSCLHRAYLPWYSSGSAGLPIISSKPVLYVRHAVRTFSSQYSILIENRSKSNVKTIYQ